MAALSSISLRPSEIRLPISSDAMRARLSLRSSMRAAARPTILARSLIAIVDQMLRYVFSAAASALSICSSVCRSKLRRISPLAGLTLWYSIMVSPFSSVSTLAKVAQHAQRPFFASVIRAMQIPERQLSELAESVRDFERGEEALTECWRTWRMCLDNSERNNRHFDRNGGIPCEPNSEAFEVFRRQSLGLRLQAKGRCSSDPGSCIKRAVEGVLRWPFEKLNIKGVRHSSGVRPVWRM